MAPRLVINLSKIAQNVRAITQQCKQRGIGVVGVTKVVCAQPEVANALIANGVSGLADSRLRNIARLKAAGIDTTYWLLRPPGQGEIAETIRLADVSLNSEIQTLRLLGSEAQRQGRPHKVVLMVDLGDLREGVWQDEIYHLYQQAMGIGGLEVLGIGANLACYGGVLPSSSNMAMLAQFGKALAPTGMLISGGNSSALHLMKTGGWQGEWTSLINNLRIGESFFLGWDITDKTPLAGCVQDACVVYAEVLEIQKKPSVPIGDIGPDAFGNVPQFIDRGLRKRAIVCLGKQDIGAGSLIPIHSGVEVLGASSDHVILDVEHHPNLSLGDEIAFRVDYGALLGLCTSEYVSKQVVKF